MSNFLSEYNFIRNEGCGFFLENKGIIEVFGKEAEQFLNGLISNDTKKLENGQSMCAAFPNAQGRLIALVRVLKSDDKFIFITEPENYSVVLQNLTRFTFAGDFKLNDLTEEVSGFNIQGKNLSSLNELFENVSLIESDDNSFIRTFFQDETCFIVKSFRTQGLTVFVKKSLSNKFADLLKSKNIIEISEDTKETFRIENGIPKYGVDLDESNVVPESGITEAISYNKGCYIGQEIIARIYFRGHVAKQLRGLIIEDNAEISGGEELFSVEGKQAGKITSVTFSPKLNKTIALAMVRYDFLPENTELKVKNSTALVMELPFKI